MSFFRRKPTLQNPPQHIAIIMDGNGRWAKKRGLPRSAGHAAGAENFRKIAIYCRKIGVEFLTVYAFSTENWSRPPDEVAAIWNILRKYLHETLDTMERDRIKLRILGDRGDMPEDVQDLLRRADEKSAKIDGITLIMCLNYGSRSELVQAVQSIVSQGIAPEDINAGVIEKHLYSAGIPDPDLIIRTSGEYRLSNFLLWQAAYSELYFTDTLWPDFSPSELDAAVADFNRRSRRFGGVGK